VTVAELSEVVTRALDFALDGEHVEAYAVHRVSTAVQVDAGAEIRQVSRAEIRGVGVRVIHDGRLGYASCSALDEADLRRTVELARSNAGVGDRDAAQGLPEPEAIPSMEGVDPALETATLTEKIDLVVDVARRVVSLDPRVRSLDTAEYHDEHKTVAIASTHGVAASYSNGYAEAWVDALGEDEHGRASDSGYQFGGSPDDCDPELLAASAVERTVRLLGPVSAPRTGLAIMLDPSVVADLLTAIGKGLSGGPVSSGRTPFKGCVGTAVGAPCVDLADEGRLRLSPAAAPFDDEAAPRRRTSLIDGGVLVGALHSTVTARAIGTSAASTGNARRATHKSPPHAAPSCLVLAPTVSLQELTSQLDEAIYIQQLSGSGAGINAVTGRVNVGGVGALLRAGEPAGRVDTISLSTTLMDFLRSISAVADDAYPVPFTPTAAATVLCTSDLMSPGR
jgi:PmbA protein